MSQNRVRSRSKILGSELLVPPVS